MSLGFFLYTMIHGTGTRSWLLRLITILLLSVLIYWIWIYFDQALTQNIVGGLLASLVGIFLTWIWREYKMYNPIYQFWGEILPIPKNEPVAIIIGYREDKNQRDMGYGQAMSLPILAHMFQSIGREWADEKQTPLIYSDEPLAPNITALIIGGPITNQHTRLMHDLLKLPYEFSTLEDGESVRVLRSTEYSTTYMASTQENKDCGMIVVWKHDASHYHIFIAGAKRLGVLAATMLLCYPQYLSKVLEKKGDIKGSFQIVFGAKVDFKREKVRYIDLDSLKVLPISIDTSTQMSQN